MKYLQKESDDFKILIEKKGLPYSSFSFKKKSGFLYIQFLDRTTPFLFHRKDSTIINDAGEWETHSDYYLTKSKDNPCDWRELLKTFNLWLDQLL